MDLLLELFRHNTMMNGRLVEACRALTPQQLDSTVVGTYGSIGATLVHIANGQDAYVARLHDVARPPALVENPFPGCDAVAERFAASDAQLEAAAAGIDDRQVTVTGDDPPGEWTMPVSLFLLQAINHATEHRSQVATMLSQLGIEPPDMSGWAFLDDSGHMMPV